MCEITIRNGWKNKHRNWSVNPFFSILTTTDFLFLQIDQTTAAFKSGKLPNAALPMGMGMPRLINPGIAPPRPGMPAIVPPFPFAFRPGMPPLGAPPNPAAMTALMALRPPPGLIPPGVPPPAVVPNPSTE